MNKKEEILNKIEAIRRKNNKMWMKLIKIAFQYAPQEAQVVMLEIVKRDKQITALCEKMIDD